jgi:hypothetical protein
VAAVASPFPPASERPGPKSRPGGEGDSVRAPAWLARASDNTIDNLERRELALLPFLLLPLLAPRATGRAGRLLPVQDDPRAAAAECPSFTARGPKATEPFAYRDRSLRGGRRPVSLRGALPRAGRSPWVVVAARPGAGEDAYDALCDHLASHGCAAFVVERGADESWWRYAEALSTAIWQARAESAAPRSRLHERLDVGRLLLVADGGGAPAAARAAADLPDLRGLVLIEPGASDGAIGWLGRARVPLLALSSGAPGGERAAAWFEAAGAEPGERWLVELETERPLAPSAADAGTLLHGDVRALVAAYCEAQLRLRDGEASSFDELARAGRIDRRIRGGAPPAARRVDAIASRR